MIRLPMPRIYQQKIDISSYKSPAYFYFNIPDLDTTNGKVYFTSNGLLNVEYDGLIEISFNLWLNSQSNTRVWIKLENYSDSKILAEFIHDMPSGYVNIVCPPIYVFNKGNKSYGIHLVDSNNSVLTNSGTGNNEASFVNVKLL